jgi:hypothetical protein
LNEEQDQSEEIQRSIDCLFLDLDVDGDGKLVSVAMFVMVIMKRVLFILGIRQLC